MYKIKMTEEHKLKIGKANKGHIVTEETRRKIGAGVSAAWGKARRENEREQYEKMEGKTEGKLYFDFGPNGPSICNNCDE
jgi:hypothetical protein